jgi:hypothetical protein
MAKLNRNLQAKYIKACAQRRESAHSEFTKSSYLCGQETFGNEIRGAKPRQSKPVEWFNRDKMVETTAHAVAQRFTRTQTPAQVAWAEAGQITLYRKGRVVA